MALSYLRNTVSSLVMASMLGVVGDAHAVELPQEIQGNNVSPAVLDSETPQVIADIEIRGNQRIDPTTIINYLGLRRGDTANRYDIDRAMRALFITGFFADIGLNYTGNKLLVDVVENPTINHVAFEGNDHLSNDDLEAEMQLKPRSIYTRRKVQSDLERLLERYRRAGRFLATVTPKLITREQNRVDLVFEIEEGPVTLVKDVSFVGNSAFSTSTLRNVVRTQEECWYCFISDGDKYDPDKLQFDKELLRKFYTTQGYADFRVSSAISELTADKSGFYITFTIDEGIKYDVGEVGLKSTLAGADEATLKDVITTESGKFYDSESVENSIDSIVSEMGNKGFAFVDVKPELKRSRLDETIDVVYHVTEGPRVYVERINITGNMRTLDSVIRREFRLVEGDPFNTSKLRRSEERLRNLGFFEDVKVTRQSGSSADRVIINVKVSEKSTGELSLGAGFSTTDGALTEIGIRERNLLGKGQDLRFKGLFAVERQQFDIGFTEPYFLDREISTGFDVFKTTQDFGSESSFDRESIGGRLRAGYTISEYLKHSLYYSFEEVTINDVRDDASLFVKQQEGTNSTSLIGHSLSYDRRNNAFDPTEGYYLRFNQDFAGIGGDSKFLRHEVKSSYYYPVADGWTFMLAGSAGHVLGSSDKNIRINNRFFVGGRTLRGFDNAGIGPRDLTTEDALGGNLFYTTTAEMRFPIGLPEELGFSGAVFVDAGNLYDVDVTGTGFADESSIRASVGFGIGWKSPFGPIRVDFSNAFRKEDYDITESFRFNFGTHF